eukprot:3293514-Prymnesium_polylepis.1
MPRHDPQQLLFPTVWRTRVAGLGGARELLPLALEDLVADSRRSVSHVVRVQSSDTRQSPVSAHSGGLFEF